jgi:group I intron endonuclease
MFIYITTNKINGKKYIGMCTRNDTNYIGSGSLLKDAIKKYGRHNFERTIIEHCNDFAELCEREKYWIDYYDAVNSKDFYNLIDGGIGGNSKVLTEYWESLSEDERKKVRNWKPHFKLNPTNGNTNFWYGKSTSHIVKEVWEKRSKKEKSEIAKKVSDTMKRKGIAKGKNNPMYGRSAVRENNLKWYTNGTENKYIPEGTEPYGFRRGRTNLSGKIGKRNDRQ